MFTHLCTLKHQLIQAFQSHTHSQCVMKRGCIGVGPQRVISLAKLQHTQSFFPSKVRNAISSITFLSIPCCFSCQCARHPAADTAHPPHLKERFKDTLGIIESLTTKKTHMAGKIKWNNHAPLSLCRSQSQMSSSGSQMCSMSHGAHVHNKENQQTREQNPKTLYAWCYKQADTCFFPRERVTYPTFTVTQCLLSHGAASTQPGRHNKWAMQTIRQVYLGERFQCGKFNITFNPEK